MRTFVREKKIYCGGDYLEVDIFNHTKTEEENARRGQRSKKEVESTPKQIDWNDKNSVRRLTQTVHANFGEGDYHVTLTYNPQNLPPTEEDGKKDRENYKRRIEYARKKEGLPPGDYIFITNCIFQKDSVTPARIHHHIIMSGGLDRDKIEDLWRKKRERKHLKGEKIGFANADRLQPDENGLAALCEYLAKQAGGKRRWSSSHGLKKPEIDAVNQNDPIPEPQPEPPQPQGCKVSTSANIQRPWSRTNDHRFSRKEIQRIATAPPDPSFWESRYPGYTLMGQGYGYRAVYSEARGWALYIKLRRIRK